jgi:hypothetical protein
VRLPRSCLQDSLPPWLYSRMDMCLAGGDDSCELMLDAIHPPLPHLPMDQDAYIFGTIGKYNVLITALPTGVYGTTSAATAGMQLLDPGSSSSGGQCCGSMILIIPPTHVAPWSSLHGFPSQDEFDCTVQYARRNTHLWICVGRDI